MSSSSSKPAAVSDAAPGRRLGWLRRPEWSRETLVALIAIYCVAAGNSAWWTAVADGRSLTDPQTWLFLGSCAIALIALHFVLLLLPSTRWTVRPWLTVVVIATACAVHFMSAYNVLLDGSMLRNIVRTDTREAGELLSLTLARDVALWSALPLAIIWWPRTARGPIGRSALKRLGITAVALVLAAGALAPISRDLISLMRNQRQLRYLITPGNFLVGLARLGMSDVRDANRPREIVGADARRIGPASTARPRVFVLVVGETARAASFAMNGYRRPTNPELARLDIVNFSDVRSCGTSIEVSIPCMFSPWGRADYDERRIRGAEGLLHVLARAGYDVLWLENQSGCKGVCDGAGIRRRKLDASASPALCRGEECDDRILLHALQTELGSVQRDSVIVLHMMGNHGPAYYRRYPDEFRRFVPDCRTAELRSCSREEIVNAYDNEILYTDHLLASAIRTLQEHDERLDGALLHVSDHRESLGEGGLYLHGMPYRIAPDVQTRVPMIYWQSAGFARAARIDVECLRQRAASPYSHDHLFHSVLSLLEVETRARRPERDLFAPCRAR